MSASAITSADVLDALEFLQKLFSDWTETGFIPKSRSEQVAAHLGETKARCVQASAEGKLTPDDMILPPLDADLADSPATRPLWWHHLAASEITRMRETGVLPLHQAEACLAELHARTSALRRQLLQERPVAEPEPVVEAAPALAPAVATRRNLLEILLDPRSIQWLLGSGGALMVVGLVILLWVNEFFTPSVVAVVLGVTNVAVLLGGWAVIQRTRYQTAGRALTLLACLVMPLNLWYYNANQLITLDGHLWVAALVISALYAASALVLREETFVYIFMAGVTLTGLLILADLPPSPERFWEIALPSTLLVVLGLLAVHVERAFPDAEGPFTRKRFGLAFFWSGHALIGAGLLLLFGAQLAGNWLYEPYFKEVYRLLGNKQPSPVVTVFELRLLALGLVLAGTYVYIYSDIVVRRIGVYLYLAALTMLWSEVLLVELLQLHLGVDALIAILAATALAVNFGKVTVAGDNSLTRPFPVLGLLLGLLPVVLGFFVYAQALSSRGVWANEAPRWGFVGAMLLTAISSRFGAHVYRHMAPSLSACYFFATAAATLIGAVALLAALGLTKWEDHAPILMLLPIVYLLAAQLYRGHTAEQPLVWVSHAVTGVMLVSSVASALHGFIVVEGQPLNLALTVFFAEVALYYGLAAALRRQSSAVPLCTAAACAAVWQLLHYAVFPAETYTLTFAVVGLALLIAYRFAVLDRFAAVRLADALLQGGNMLLSLAFAASTFLSLSRLATGHVHWSLVLMCLALGAISLVAAALVQQEGWRRWYVVAAIGQGLLTILAVQALSELNPWQKLEIFSVALGLLLLVAGHVGWYREQDLQSDMVSLSLFLGSLLAGVPLAVATIIDRAHGDFAAFHVFNEMGFLTVGVLLLVTGVLFQLRATTLNGVALTTLYFASLLMYVPWGRLNAVATFITAGGGTIFLVGLLLSVYRERLKTLPDRVRRREGIFRVFGWR
jgi:hypothetical protein